MARTRAPRDNKAPSAAALPSAVPSAPAKPAPRPVKKKKLVDRYVPTNNTILSDPITIIEGIKAEYDWEDPSLAPEVVEHDEPAEVAAVQTPIAVQTPTAAHSPASLYLAKQLGMDDAEIAEYKPADLDKFVTNLHRHREEMRREAAVQQAVQQPRTTTSPATSAEAVNLPVEEALPWGVDEDGKPITDDQIHPAIVNVVKALRAEVKELKAGYANLMQSEQVRQGQTISQKLDAMFAKNPDQFGAEDGDTIQKSDPAKYQRRLAVLQVMKSLASGTMAERFDEAHQIMYGPVPTAPAAAATTQPAAAAKTTPPKDPATGQFVKPAKEGAIHTEEEWENAGLELPTNRLSTVAVDPKKKAIESVGKILRDHPEALGGGIDYTNEFIGSNGQA